jgi:hypothetical protein
MAELGQPYRVIYEAKNFQGGLANISVSVRLPNSTTEGPFALAELPAPFAGTYFYDYNTGLGDPQGNYLFLVTSTDEGGHKSGKTEYFAPPVAAGSGLTAEQVQNILLGILGTDRITIEAEPDAVQLIKVEADDEEAIESQADAVQTVSVEPDTEPDVETDQDDEIIIEV